MPTIRNYLSLIKFSHTIFAMPFAFIGFTLGLNNYPGNFFAMSFDEIVSIFGLKFLLVILCMVFARSAAMAFNRYLDRKFDERNPRTAIREIPAGIISARNALLFTIVCSVLFMVASWFINPICFYLSPVALLVVLGYSYTKRFTPLCHIILGTGLALAPIGAYIAVTGRFDILPTLFSFTVLFWVSGFDIIYALQDEEFDKSQGLNSIPAALGKPQALRVSEILHILSAICLIAAGTYGEFGLFYWVGFGVFLIMLIYQHSIVKPGDLSRVNIAFMTANGIASIVFAVFVIVDVLKES